MARQLSAISSHDATTFRNSRGDVGRGKGLDAVDDGDPGGRVRAAIAADMAKLRDQKLALERTALACERAGLQCEDLRDESARLQPLGIVPRNGGTLRFRV
jgi:hypothetical protein